MSYFHIMSFRSLAVLFAIACLSESDAFRLKRGKATKATATTIADLNDQVVSVVEKACGRFLQSKACSSATLASVGNSAVGSVASCLAVCTSKGKACAQLEDRRVISGNRVRGYWRCSCGDAVIAATGHKWKPSPLRWYGAATCKPMMAPRSLMQANTTASCQNKGGYCTRGSDCCDPIGCHNYMIGLPGTCHR
jgi:hypothetical protein